MGLQVEAAIQRIDDVIKLEIKITNMSQNVLSVRFKLIEF